MLFKKLLALICLSSAASFLHAQTWSVDSNLTNSPGGSYTAFNNAHSLAASGENIYFVWYDFFLSTNMGCQVRFKMYDGTSWSPDTTIGYYNNRNMNNWNPSCAVDPSGMVHVVWESNENTLNINNYRIWYKNYKNNLWSSVDILTSSDGAAIYPSLAASPDGKVYAVWQYRNNGISRIYYRSYYNTGWGGETCLSNDGTQCFYPAIAISQNQPVVVWQDYDDGISQIHCRIYSSGAWGQDSILSHSNYGAFCPSLAADDSGNVYVVWEEWSSNHSEIYCRKFNYQNKKWDQEIRVSDGGLNSENPVIVCGSSGSDIFWSDNRDGYYEIYHKALINGFWGAEERMTYQESEAILPSALSDARGNVYLVWTGNDQNYKKDIYFKKLIIDPWPSKQALAVQHLPSACKMACYPNPVKDRANINFKFLQNDLGAGSSTNREYGSIQGSLEIFNVNGQLIRSMPQHFYPENEGNLTWDCRNDRGEKVSSGVYLVELNYGQSKYFTKIAVVR